MPNNNKNRRRISRNNLASILKYLKMKKTKPIRLITIMSILPTRMGGGKRPKITAGDKIIDEEQ
jgi:hypothetical protein